MKGFFTFRLLCVSLFTLLKIAALAQPDYTFLNSVLESGTNLQPGSVYKFANVKGGTDARITVMGSTGGVTLNAIDENWTGFDEAFQPFINVAPNANGYVEFKIDFYDAGTSNLKLQGQIPVTCIDVDGLTFGDGFLYENDRVQFLPGFFDWQMSGGNLEVTVNNWWVNIKNISGFSYEGIDTSAKDVMTTVLNRNTSSFLLRIGAINTSPTQSIVRYRSVYFKRFYYGHPPPLAQASILNLNGSKKPGGVELNTTLAAGHTFNKMIIERSLSSSSSFSAIGQMNIAPGEGASSPLVYFDTHVANENNYYRVRIFNSQTGKEELSNTLMIKAVEKTNSPEITTSILQPANPVLAVRCQEEGEANLQLFDMSGRSIVKTKVRLNSGSNSFNLPSFNAGRGYLVVVLETKNNQLISRKLMVQ